MALSVYTPTGIVHETSVDFTKRVLTESVHLVQYDESLPVVAVTCLDAGQYMTLTALDTVSIRMDKGDGTFIYNPALGMSADGHIVYIQITLQMTANYGRFEPVIELLRDGGYGASSPIPLFIDANPVPNSEIQSTSQWESLNDIVARANAIVAGDAVEFTEAETRENINSGENLITMFGKIKKWFTDFGAAAWKSVANNLTTASAGTAVLDAYQGKVLNDKISGNVVNYAGMAYASLAATLVTLKILGGATFKADGYTLNIELISQHRPVYNVSMLAIVYNGSSYVNCIVTAKSNGEVTITAVTGGAISGIVLDYMTPRVFIYPAITI